MFQTVKSEQFIKAPPKNVYLALTRAMFLRQWLCDFATVNPRPGGRMYLWWNGDFYSAGEYIVLEEDRLVKFKWHGRFEPALTEVTVTLTPRDDGTHVGLVHSVPDGDEWKERSKGFKAEWDSTLPNLASLLETGLDRRIYDRPMLGIQINDFNAEIAKTVGVPVSEGIRLADVVVGMGAQVAGLTHDDVIVEFNGKPITNDFGSLVMALQGKKGGDPVDVVFYRGPEKHSITMQLSKRLIPEIPWDPAELSAQVRARYDQGLKILEDAFSGVTEAEAGRSPGLGEWSAMQTLAHLIHTERNWLANMDDAVGGYDRNSDDFGGNITAHINATLTAYGSVARMLEEMKHLSDEVVAFLANLPPEFVTWKGNYINVGNTMLNGMLPHTQSHIEQIKKAISAAPK